VQCLEGLLVGCFALLFLAGCGGVEEFGAEAFQALASDQLAAERGTQASLQIVFVPDLHGCAPQQVEAIAALQKFETSFSDAKVVTALAFADREARSLLGHALPGERLVTSRQRIATGGMRLPIPRVEAWGPGGELLLLKQISFPIDRKDLFHELEWLRANSKASRIPTSAPSAG
jgi:hypothetical protein